MNYRIQKDAGGENVRHPMFNILHPMFNILRNGENFVLDFALWGFNFYRVAFLFGQKKSRA